MATIDVNYLMEDPREAARLAEKVRPDEWVDRYFATYLSAVGSLLDVGCGPGVMLTAISRRFPGIALTGLDGSDRRLAVARDNLSGTAARLLHASATEIPLESNSVDMVVCRLLLEYLDDREQAIAEMVRVVNPGGRVVLQDLDGQIVWHWPIDVGLKQQVERVLAHLQKSGFDPFVGRKLFSFAYAAGLSQIEVRVDPYHLIYGRVDEHTYRLWELKLDILLPVAAEALGCESAAQGLKKQFLDYLCRDDSLTYSTIFTVTGIKSKSPLA